MNKMYSHIRPDAELRRLARIIRGGNFRRSQEEGLHGLDFGRELAV